MLGWSLSFLVLAVQLLPPVVAQTTNATCLPFYNWTFNSRKQTPCEVASILLATCSGSYNVAALPDQSYYVGPPLALANPCQCSTVVYSLMSACGACQGRTYQSWSSWSGNCATVSINSFPEPIPPQVFVPGWAYLDVKANDIFDETAAKQNSNKTESTAIPSSPRTTSPTVISTHSSSVVSLTITSPSVSHTTSPSSSTTTTLDSRANAIAGGIVGGGVGLAIIITLVYWFSSSRRRRIAESRVPLHSPIEEPHIQESADMRQYLANTVPAQLTSSSINTSLPSPTSAQFSASSGPGSIRSVGRSDRPAENV